MKILDAYSCIGFFVIGLVLFALQDYPKLAYGISGLILLMIVRHYLRLGDAKREAAEDTMFEMKYKGPPTKKTSKK